MPYIVYFEFIHIKDVVAALISALKKKKDIQRILLVGDGAKLCMQYKKIINDLFFLSGHKLSKSNKFSSKPYLTECFNTKRSQNILKYQKHSYKDFLLEMRQQIKKQKG